MEMSFCTPERFPEIVDVHPAATQNFPVLPDFSFDITLFGVLTANYCKLCVRVQRQHVKNIFLREAILWNMN
jgi:hypothetical protein